MTKYEYSQKNTVKAIAFNKNVSASYFICAETPDLYISLIINSLSYLFSTTSILLERNTLKAKNRVPSTFSILNESGACKALGAHWVRRKTPNHIQA